MSSNRFRFLLCAVIAVAATSASQTPTPSPPSSSSKPAKRSAALVAADIFAGSTANGVYRNNLLTLSCRIPPGWVLRTAEMNVREENSETKTSSQATKGGTCDGYVSSGGVLLAAFSRPPEAKGEDVNASILIAAESAASYPGLRDAAQYFGPVTEVANAQGFAMDDEPYEFAIGTKTLVRGDFHKDVGTRVMRQSTLVVLARGYAVSITFIGGTDDEVEELVQGLSFGVAGKPAK